MMRTRGWLAAAAIFLCAASAAAWMGPLIGGGVATGGGWTPDFSESFSGAVTACTSYTAEHAWGCIGTNDLDADVSSLGGNFSGQGMRSQTSGWNSSYAQVDLGSAHAAGWYSFDAYVNALADASGSPFMRACDDASCTNFAAVNLLRDGASYYVSARIDETSYATQAISVQTPVKIELFLDNTAGTWELWVGGVLASSGANDPGFDARYVELGPQWHGDADVYFDNFVFDQDTRPSSQE